MGTSSVIATPAGSLGWKGRYVHWDGYPTGVGESLRRIINRDGVLEAVRRLTQDRYGWSNIDPEEAGPVPDYMQDGRFATEVGYGTAYTTAAGQSTEDEWVTRDGDDWGTEWAYVVQEGAIEVLFRNWRKNGSTWDVAGVVLLNDAEGMQRVESSVYASVSN